MITGISAGFREADHATKIEKQQCGDPVARSVRLSFTPIEIARATSGSRRRGHWASVHQLFGARIHSEVESLERARAEQHHVARFAEHDFVDRDGTAGVDD